VHDTIPESSYPPQILGERFVEHSRSSQELEGFGIRGGRAQCVRGADVRGDLDTGVYRQLQRMKHGRLPLAVLEEIGLGDLSERSQVARRGTYNRAASRCRQFRQRPYSGGQMKRIVSCCLTVLLLSACGTPTDDAGVAPATEDEAAVSQTVERFFAAMAARDAAAYQKLTVEDAMTIAARVSPDGVSPIRLRTHAEHAAELEASEQPWRERMWDPVVLVHGPIALVWTAYDFHEGDAFSHCGIDVFELLKLDGRWRIANASWTVETVGCHPGPVVQTTVLAAEERAVLSTMERMFAAMATRDVDGYAATLLPEGRFSRHRIGEAATGPLRMVTNAQDIVEFRAATGRWDERFWNPVVLVHPPLAVVWTPYDFHVDGRFSHCGIDNFQFFKTESGWKLTNASWTIQREGCEPSPLGPLPPR
jgi:hypothetical protein